MIETSFTGIFGVKTSIAVEMYFPVIVVLTIIASVILNTYLRKRSIT